MEFVHSAKKHSSLLSEAIYIVLNIGLAVAVFFSVYLFPDLPILAFLLVLLSKWRVFAVRPRFWWENIQSNLLDAIFGFAIVTLLWQSQDIIVQVIVGLVYGLWLVLLKPRSDRASTLAQAVVAQFFTVMALFTIAHDLPSWAVVAVMWMIGYITARHILSAFEETEITMLSLIWGLIVAELGWLAYHWTVAYGLMIPGSVFKIPQIAIIITLLSYFTATSYTMYAEKGKVSAKNLFWPALFAGGIILFILLFFNGTDPGS